MTEVSHSAAPQPDARQRLLAAALDQFTRRGYAAATVREMCEAAVVTKPVLYYYFKSKEGLYLELMDGGYALFESTVADLDAYQGSAKQRIIHFCEVMFDVAIQNLPVVRLIYSIYFGPPQGAPPYNLDRYYDRMLEIISRLVRTGVERGELRDGDMGDITWTCLSCLNTAIEEQLCHPVPRIDRAGMLRMLELIFSGIAARDSG